MRPYYTFPFLLSSSCYASTLSYDIKAPYIPKSQDQIGCQKIIVSQDYIKSHHPTFVTESLRAVPGITLNEMGPAGRTVEYTMRGARSSQNLVLIEGVPANNPAAGGKFDFADLLIDNISQIELFPGSNSVLYGSDALGGVINVTTVEGKGKPKAKAKAEVGNFKTAKASIHSSGEMNNFTYSTTGTFFKSGNGAFKNKLHDTKQSDDYRNASFSNRASIPITPFWELETHFHYTNARVKIDDYRLIPSQKIYLPTTADAYSYLNEILGGIKNSWETIPETWNQTLSFTLSGTNRKTTFPHFRSQNYGQHLRTHYRSDIKIDEKNILTLGSEWGQEYIREKGKFRHSRNHTAIFAQHLIKPIPSLSFLPGVRMDHYSKRTQKITYRLAAEYQIADAIFHTTFATGFKAPTLSDLYNSDRFALPNPFLKPEKSHSFDIGVSQPLLNQKLKLSLTYFFMLIDNVTVSRFIQGKFQRVNNGHRRAQGIESSLSFSPFKEIDIMMSATYTHARDSNKNTKNKKTALIPAIKLTNDIQLKPIKDLTFIFTSYAYSNRLDAVTHKKLAGYATFSIGASYNLTPSVQFYSKVENLTDKAYEEVFGYGVRGRTFLCGLSAVY